MQRSIGKEIGIIHIFLLGLRICTKRLRCVAEGVLALQMVE
jgi:hypothetical protein